MSQVARLVQRERPVEAGPAPLESDSTQLLVAVVVLRRVVREPPSPTTDVHHHLPSATPPRRPPIPPPPPPLDVSASAIAVASSFATSPAPTSARGSPCGSSRRPALGPRGGGCGCGGSGSGSPRPPPPPPPRRCLQLRQVRQDFQHTPRLGGKFLHFLY